MSLEFDLVLPRREFELRLAANFGKELIGVFGPSGAGKTSFFNLLAGLERPSAGRIVLNGRILTDVEENLFVPVNKRRIGVVFQEKLLFPHLSVRDNLLFGRKYAKGPEIPLESVAELLDLTTLLDARPADISGGEAQRTAIGRALLSSPELLLMDEPFNAVDSALRRSILPYLKRLGNELDIPMLVISHDLPDIRRLTEKVYLIENGRSAGFGNAADLFDTCRGPEETRSLTG
jgi:molybdate transport system ATP-binding protein